MPMNPQGRRWMTLVLAAAATLAGDLAAQAADPALLQWSLVPPILPPGARIAVVSGDPTIPGMTTVELIMPNGYRMPPHSSGGRVRRGERGYAPRGDRR
jgi:hypothetical protein